MSPLANVCRWSSTTLLRILPCHSSNCPTSPHRGLYGNSPPKSLSWRAVFPSLSLRERGRVRVPAVSPIYGAGSTLATTCVSEKGRRMPVQTHVVKVVFLVLCLSMLTLQNGCSNPGSGQAKRRQVMRNRPTGPVLTVWGPSGYGRWPYYPRDSPSGHQWLWRRHVRRVRDLCHDRWRALGLARCACLPAVSGRIQPRGQAAAGV